MSPSETASTEAIQGVVALLNSAAKPLTFGQLKKAARLGDAAVKEALETAVKQGVVFRWPDFRRSQYFWSQSPDQAAEHALLTLASEEAISRTKLIARARKRIPGFPQNAMQRIVTNLVAGHQLQQVPAFTAGSLLVRSGRPAAYAATARRFIEEKFRKAGFDPAPIFSPPAPAPNHIEAQPSVDAAAQILEAIQAMEPVAGVPVSAQSLRHHLPALDKRDFDAAALELRRKQQASLSLHHDPHNLPQQERDLLIDGGDGTYYVAIAIRR